MRAMAMDLCEVVGNNVELQTLLRAMEANVINE